MSRAIRVHQRSVQVVNVAVHCVSKNRTATYMT